MQQRTLPTSTLAALSICRPKSIASASLRRMSLAIAVLSCIQFQDFYFFCTFEDRMTPTEVALLNVCIILTEGIIRIIFQYYILLLLLIRLRSNSHHDASHPADLAASLV